MNKKAEQLRDYLGAHQIGGYTIKELRDDPMQTNAFEFTFTVNGNNFPLYVILDTSMFVMIRLRVATRSVVDTNRAAVVELLNRFTQEVKPLKYYVDPAGDIIIDACVFAKENALDSELVYTMIQIIGQQIDTQYPEMMQALQA